MLLHPRNNFSVSTLDRPLDRWLAATRGDVRGAAGTTDSSRQRAHGSSPDFRSTRAEVFLRVCTQGRRLTAERASHGPVRRFSPGAGVHADWARFCFYKTYRGNLPSLAFYGMRSQHKFVITAGLLCHLFVTAPLVTSQALADQSAQNPPAPAEQATPSPTPAPAEQTGQSATPRESPIGNCHLIITSPPAAHAAGSNRTGSQIRDSSATAQRSLQKRCSAAHQRRKTGHHRCRRVRAGRRCLYVAP